MSTVNGVTSSTPTSSSSTSSSTDPLLDKDAFLKLLTASMQYQDPLNPTDSSTYMTQMSQLSEVEQMTNMATQTQQMVTTQSQSSDVALIGKTVSYMNADGSTTTGLVSDVALGGGSPSLTVDGQSGIDPSTIVDVSQ